SQVLHFLNGDPDQLLAPAAHSVRLLRRQPLAHTILETEGRIEVRAHKIVLELSRLIERMQGDLPRDHPLDGRAIVHESLLLRRHSPAHRRSGACLWHARATHALHPEEARYFAHFQLPAPSPKWPGPRIPWSGHRISWDGGHVSGWVAASRRPGR